MDDEVLACGVPARFPKDRIHLFMPPMVPDHRPCVPDVGNPALSYADSSRKPQSVLLSSGQLRFWLERHQAAISAS
jgi:hypothetical protein